MGYFLEQAKTLQRYIKNANVTILKDAGITITNKTYAAYTGVIEFTFEKHIEPTSTFRLYLQMQRDGVGGSCFGKWQHNGADIGVEHSTVGGGWETFTDDITGESWVIGNTITLLIKKGTSGTVSIQNARIYAMIDPYSVKDIST